MLPPPTGIECPQSLLPSYLAVAGWEYFEEKRVDGRGYLETRPVGAPYGRRITQRHLGEPGGV